MSEMIETLRKEENMTPKQIEIVRAAIELISEKGYYNTSTSEIAKRAGVAEGTIFRHYRTKKDLLVAIVTLVITNFSAPLFAKKFVDRFFGRTMNMLKTCFIRSSKIALNLLRPIFHC